MVKIVLVGALLVLTAGASVPSPRPTDYSPMIPGPVYVFHISNCALNQENPNDVMVACWNLVRTDDHIVVAPITPGG